MKRKTPLIVLLIILIGGGIAAGVVYNMWNKPHAKAEDAKGMAIGVDSLCHEYAADETAANTKYLNKVLNVSGRVVKNEKNQDGALVVTIQGTDPDVSVLCTMRDKNKAIEEDKQVTMKGFCSGADLFGVLLTDCIAE